MPDTLPPAAINATDTISEIERRYTPDEISAYIKSFVASIANGQDSAMDELSEFINALPQDWKTDEASF
jgi:TolA-binding protein